MTTPKRNRTIALVASLAAAVAIIPLSACGTSGPSAEEKRKEAQQRERQKAVAAAHECEKQLGDFLTTLEELDSRLGVGMNYDEYMNAVGDAMVAYDQIPINRLSLDCTSSVGLPSENALRRFSNAADSWSDCFSDFDCSMDVIDPELQDQWSRASEFVSTADQGLGDLSNP